MKKLVLTYDWNGFRFGEDCRDISHVPFEYVSKEQFIIDVKEKYKDKVWGQFECYRGVFEDEVPLVGTQEYIWLTKEQIENIGEMVYTLDEWFEQHKETEMGLNLRGNG